MRKKKEKSRKASSAPRRTNSIVIQSFDETPNRFKSKLDPINHLELRDNFLERGQIPQFQICASHNQKARHIDIKFDLLPEAVAVLEKVCSMFGSGDVFLNKTFGDKITVDEATDKVKGYLYENNCNNQVKICWSKDLLCSGKMCWHGPCIQANRPEARTFNLLLQNSKENMFLREHGIVCLADHEIGTHYLRMYNDGLQPWFSQRQQFGIGRLRSKKLLETEEGLATINTLLKAKHQLLWKPALLYYTACKSLEMSFQQLYDHLGTYVRDSNYRWKLVMRVKRVLDDVNDVGGYGKDQCYFTGAVQLLRNIDETDFVLLYSGRIAVEELPRIRRLARMNCIKLPTFLQDVAKYKQNLWNIAVVNNLVSKDKLSPKRAKLKKINISVTIPSAKKYSKSCQPSKKTVRTFCNRIAPQSSSIMSPIPYSPHKWMLSKRPRSCPNTFEKSKEKPKPLWKC
ncbi:microtubule-associated tyrosine carboxypeptidase 1-like [Antedon mediterranea]|uniref:microtubule-associated tyrosine carboxypeptidase 1-like n=1 Tax=Antedon mediterranea TaxID=105859 RepID=UPI003AF91CBC